MEKIYNTNHSIYIKNIIMDYSKFEFKGKCPICERDMYDAFGSIDKHHFIPKCKGGKETTLIHLVCHRKVHSLFTEAECAKEYSDPELVKAHPEMQKFIKWISKKEPTYVDHSKDSQERKNKRKK